MIPISPPLPPKEITQEYLSKNRNKTSKDKVKSTEIIIILTSRNLNIRPYWNDHTRNLSHRWIPINTNSSEIYLLTLYEDEDEEDIDGKKRKSTLI
ncbi:11170_t:CDS:2 [Scutellospora calospora]|uniref:11170_t:CDS:1 n=1 Tax=Scutellospora calospora TaxID=85575 RepID=A0ACA9MIA1_9GLOM|nr:11170_t:CDS:2 [Scutellospora calospora]